MNENYAKDISVKVKEYFVIKSFIESDEVSYSVFVYKYLSL